MKKTLLMLLAVAALIQCGATAFAQSFVPRETWPYLYADFVQGGVFTSDGKVITDGEVNISVADGKLHYVSGRKIMAANMLNVGYARIGGETYLNLSGKMHLLMDERGSGKLLKLTEVDMSRYGKQDIGYGISSATASKQDLNVAALDGAGMLNLSLDEYVEQARLGKPLPLKETYLIVFKGRVVEATRKDVVQLPGVDEAAFTAFAKKAKIKWHKVESLLKVIDYLNDNIQGNEAE